MTLKLSDPFEPVALRLAAVVRLDSGVARRLYRFLVVGVASSGAYVAILNLGVVVFGLSATVSAIVAYVLGGVASYVGNTLWGFGAALTAATAWRFTVVILTTFALNTGLVWLLERMGTHHVVISLISAAFIAPCNFAGHSLFTYRGRTTVR
jgi:putative flippase GtrA